MQAEIVCQGRQLSAEQLSWLQQWIGIHPDWSRQRLSRVLCQEWDWRNGRGRLKDFAARSLLEKLAYRGLVTLPPLQWQSSHCRSKPVRATVLEWPPQPPPPSLSQLLPLQWIVPEVGQEFWHRFDAYLQSYHSCLSG